MIRIQEQDFDIAAELQKLRGSQSSIGAIANFVGIMRDSNNGKDVSVMTLEHYPKMAEQILEGLEQQALQRWNLIDTVIIHRVGKLTPGDNIVLIAVASKHRHDAFAACEFLIDQLKTAGPFWKQERADGDTRWVEERDSDKLASKRWQRETEETSD
ncbi:MAG TPA: molybdenum cofactor biosynthesis protein MoaE [Acidiferrobacteraceae bacterium]|nr:molybdenum cofactor biosynthesis protein MoaE [Acidiferrobacteraceae bacterium]